MEEALKELTLFAADIAHEELRRVVLLGMGGSSLAPLVLERIFGRTGGLPLTVLDTTDPATILRVEREVPIAQTLFIVSSKSGTTAEPLALGEYFYSRLSELRAGAGRNFVVITDPGTPLARMGKEREYRRVFLNFPGIGGRYSALSYFGLVPAALMGIDVAELVALALRMAHACASCVPVPENPGVILGAALGELAAHGRDKVTFLMPRQIAPLGMWLEQLLAESTGKRGTGLLPVAGEPLGRPDVYGEDRLFVHVRLKGEEDTELEKGVAALREDGLPVISIQMDGKLDLGQEFLRWEIATAAAGAVLGINPFDQPNVQEAKDSTNRVLELARKTGWAPPHHPSLTEDGLGFYTRSPDESAVETLRSFLSQAAQGDYFALLAYLPEEDPTEKQLQSIRVLVRDQLHLATTSGYGPRYLHSTGQYHKGGPKTGLFLILTADNAADASVPGQPYTFGLLKSAQVTGDREVLQRQGRRVMRIHLGADVPRGLGTLRRWIEAALDGVHPRQATAAGSGRRPR